MHFNANDLVKVTCTISITLYISIFSSIEVLSSQHATSKIIAFMGMILEIGHRYAAAPKFEISQQTNIYQSLIMTWQYCYCC